MEIIEPGDLVRKSGSHIEMLVVCSADDDENCGEPSLAPSFFCVWEHEHMLHEEVVSIEQMKLVRRERRRVPRRGILPIPRF